MNRRVIVGPESLLYFYLKTILHSCPVFSQFIYYFFFSSLKINLYYIFISQLFYIVVLFFPNLFILFFLSLKVNLYPLIVWDLLLLIWDFSFLALSFMAHWHISIKMTTLYYFLLTLSDEKKKVINKLGKNKTTM